jgi:hypothetical protein
MLVSYDGVYVTVPTNDKLFIFNTTTGVVSDISVSNVNGASMSSDASHIATTSTQNDLVVYAAGGTGDAMWSTFSNVNIGTVPVERLQLNHDGTFLALALVGTSVSLWSRSGIVWVNQQTIAPNLLSTPAYSAVAISDNGLRLVRGYMTNLIPIGAIEYFERSSTSVPFPTSGFVSKEPFTDVLGPKQDFYGAALIGTADLDKVLVSGSILGTGTYLVDPKTGSSAFQTFFARINGFFNQSMSADGRVILCSVAPVFGPAQHLLQAYFEGRVLVE